MTKRIGCVAVVAIAVLMMVERAAAQPYTVVELPLPPGQTAVSATDINNRLQIVGSAGGEVIVWDGPNASPRAVGISDASSVKINNAGVIAGDTFSQNQSQPFVLAGGVLYRPRTPQGASDGLTALLDNGFLILGGLPSWAVFNDTIYDLTAITGAGTRIFAGNDAALLGGSRNTFALLRYPDGGEVIPWSETNSSVRWIGPAGHFAGYAVVGFPPFSSANLYYGRPDGRVTLIGNVGIPSGRAGDINRRGDWIVTGETQIRPFGGDASPYIVRNDRLVNLNALVLDYPLRIQRAYAINDAGYIVASAIMGGFGFSFGFTPRPVLLVPTAPRAPADLAYTISGRTVTLTWKASVGALDYVIEVGNFPGATNLMSAPIGPDTRLTASAPPGRYYVRVRARSEVGSSVASAEVVIDVS